MKNLYLVTCSCLWAGQQEDFDVYCVADNSGVAGNAALALMRAWGYKYNGWVSNVRLLASDAEYKAPSPLVIS